MDLRVAKQTAMLLVICTLVLSMTACQFGTKTTSVTGYCSLKPGTYPGKEFSTEEACIAAGGKWVSNSTVDGSGPRENPESGGRLSSESASAPAETSANTSMDSSSAYSNPEALREFGLKTFRATFARLGEDEYVGLLRHWDRYYPDKLVIVELKGIWSGFQYDEPSLADRENNANLQHYFFVYPLIYRLHELDPSGTRIVRTSDWNDNFDRDSGSLLTVETAAQVREASFEIGIEVVERPKGSFSIVKWSQRFQNVYSVERPNDGLLRQIQNR